MQRQGLLDFWHSRDISAGTEWKREISKHLSDAEIILLLVSPDFMASDYCYGTEMKRALERHHRKEACVIPIILRPVHWKDVLGNIQALPTDGKPVMSSSWHSLDDAFLIIEDGIRNAIKALQLLKHTEMEVVNVASHSFGILMWVKDQSTGHGREIIWNLIHVNDPLPIMQTKILRTYEAYQEAFEIKLMENLVQADQVDDKLMGEEIGSLILDLPLNLPINAPIEVMFEFNSDGRLHVTGREPTSNKTIEVIIETRWVKQSLTWKDD